MTTNYLLFELVSKMEHEERLHRSQQIYEQLRDLPQQVNRNWSSLLSSWRSLFTAKSVDQARRVPSAITPVTEPTTPEPIQLRPLCKNEEEWVKVFRMIRNRKLSVEQATQLLSALNG